MKKYIYMGFLVILILILLFPNLIRPKKIIQAEEVVEVTPSPTPYVEIEYDYKDTFYFFIDINGTSIETRSDIGHTTVATWVKGKRFEASPFTTAQVSSRHGSTIKILYHGIWYDVEEAYCGKNAKQLCSDCHVKLTPSGGTGVSSIKPISINKNYKL